MCSGSLRSDEWEPSSLCASVSILLCVSNLRSSFSGCVIIRGKGSLFPVPWLGDLGSSGFPSLSLGLHPWRTGLTVANLPRAIVRIQAHKTLCKGPLGSWGS